jgi:hypothetical protein
MPPVFLDLGATASTSASLAAQATKALPLQPATAESSARLTVFTRSAYEGSAVIFVPPRAVELHWHPQTSGTVVLDGAMLLTVAYVTIKPLVARSIRARLPDAFAEAPRYPRRPRQSSA